MTDTIIQTIKITIKTITEKSAKNGEITPMPKQGHKIANI
jgi:hypothetical protein